MDHTFIFAHELPSANVLSTDTAAFRKVTSDYINQENGSIKHILKISYNPLRSQLSPGCHLSHEFQTINSENKY